MALIEFNRNPPARDIKLFAFAVLPGVCLAAAGWLLWRHAAQTAAVVLVASATLSVILGVAKPGWMRLVYLGWMLAAFPIGWLVAHLLLAVIYFLVITPIGLVMRLLGRDPLGMRFDRPASTYWTPRPQTTDPARYFRQF